MSTTTPSATALPPAPWKQLFASHISKMSSPEFVLGTLDTAPNGSPVPLVPRVRYCIFRGFWAELPENAHNDAPRNPPIFSSDCPTFTTDVRMEKVAQIFKTSAGHAESAAQVQGSGGGGPVEAVYWVKETMTQWRVKGRAYVIADDIEGGEESSGVRTVKSEVGKRMRAVQEGREGEWSWEREVTGFFGNQSPGIKGMVAPSCPNAFQQIAKGWWDCVWLMLCAYRILQEPASRQVCHRVLRRQESAARLKDR